MKPLSPRALELVHALARPPSPFARLTGSRVPVLTELRLHAEPGIVVYLLPFLASHSNKEKMAAAAALTAALDAATPEELLELDESCRRVSEHGTYWDTSWAALRPVDLSRYSSLGDDEASVIGMATFHANGHVRETAITRLDLLASERALPFLLIRLNDWVTPVADRAAAAVERRIEARYAAWFLANLSLIERLGLRRRRDHRALIEHVYELLQGADQRPILIEGLRASDRRTRRLCFQLAWNDSRENQLVLLRRALSDPEPVIRLEAVSRARRDFEPRDWDSVLDQLFSDPNALVRLQVLPVAADHIGEQGMRYLRDALVDPNRAVREVARFYLRRRREMSDFATEYRALITSGSSTKKLAAAISGLGETGRRDDVPLMLAFLSHPRPSVRRAAVEAIGILDGDARLPLLVEALRDRSGGVSRAARNQLHRRENRIAREVHDVFCSATELHVRRHALTVLGNLGKWACLPYLIEAAADRVPEIAMIGHRRLGEWVQKQNRTMAQPTREQLESLSSALRAHSHVLHRMIADELAANLRFWAAELGLDVAHHG